MSSKISVLTLFLFAGCLVPNASFASTVDLTVEPTSGSPYVFDVNGASTFTELSCLDDQRSINVGESWVATAENLGILIANATKADPGNPQSVSAEPGVPNALTIGELEADAYLDSKYTPDTTSTTNTEIQDAIWSILDNSDVYYDLDTSGPSQATEDLAVQNYVAAAKSSRELSPFYYEFTFYIPTVYGQSNQNDQSGTIPQEFLGYCPKTPEPSSLILLGTGIVGVAGAMRLRMKAAAVTS